MSTILQDLSGTLCQMDDVLVFGKTQQEHDDRLTAVLARIRDAGVNPDKCVFSKWQVKLLGHIVDQNGIQQDPDKTSAIDMMPKPTNLTELRQFMGMVNHLGKFSLRIAELTQPLRELLSSKNAWVWNLVNETRNSLPLRSSSGAALLQKDHEGNWRPVAVASKVHDRHRTMLCSN